MLAPGVSVRRSRLPWRLAVLAVLATAGCAPSKPPPPQVNLTGFPPAFRDGYAAGCDSARRGTTQRDEKRFAQDRQYAAGWRDGLDACGKPRKPQ
jgi:hypothetical protein